MECEVEPVLDEPAPQPLDGPCGDAVAVGDLVVGECGRAVGLVESEEHERALDGLGLLAAACDEGFETVPLVGREANVVDLGHG